MRPLPAWPVQGLGSQAWARILSKRPCNFSRCSRHARPSLTSQCLPFSPVPAARSAGWEGGSCWRPGRDRCQPSPVLHFQAGLAVRSAWRGESLGPAVARGIKEAEWLQASPCPSLGLSGAAGQGLWDLPGQRFSKGVSKMGSEEDGVFGLVGGSHPVQHQVWTGCAHGTAR